MTFRWSSESIVAEYKELQANTMAVDVNGQYALLAGRRNIAIIDLEKPTEIVKRMARTQQKYNVTVAEWNPNSSMKNTFVLAAGDKAEVFSWNEGNLLSESTLKAHTRTITDLNWHRSEPVLLATSSIDTFIHIWDARETRKPSISLSAVAGASQVKWNKLNADYLASGHDCDIRIWDRRKANQPVCYINAHLSKIHGLDWSPNHDTQIVSSSNDSTVKFFDITNPRKSEIYINTQNPVWRARYTPFGEGLVTVVVPPLRRSENSLLLWSMMDASNPVHTFVGHCDIVLEFDWLYKPNSDMHSADYQLITWAKDNSLRIWKIDPQLLKICGHSIDEEVTGTDEANTESSDAETLLGYENGDNNIMATKVLEEYTSVTNKEIISILSQRNSFDTLNVNGHPQSDSERKTIPRNLSFCESPKEIISQSPDTPGQRSLSQTPCALEPSIIGGSQSNMHTCNLQQEFITLNSSFGKNVEIVPDAEKRICQVTVRHLSYVAVLAITFPPKYPNGSCPSFRFSAGTNLDSATKAELLRVLKSTALQYTSIKKKKGCLEPCLKILLSQLKALLTEERTNVLDMPQLHLNNSFFLQMYGSQQDYTIPFPRTSGARFCSSGYLVCFTRPSVWKHSASRERTLTPRSLSALGAHINSLYPQLTSGSATSPKYNYLYPVTGQSPSTEQNISIAMYYYQDRKMKSKRVREDESGRHHRNHGVITIYDVAKLIPISKELASNYVIDEEDSVTSCNLNKEAAASLGRKDMAQVWAISSTLLSMNSLYNKDEDYPFIHHPFGRKLALLLINHYHSRFDIQTAALLSCVFGENLSKTNKNKNFDPWRNKSDSSSSSYTNSRSGLRSRRQLSVMAKLDMLNMMKYSNKTGSSPYNTIHGVNTDGWEMSSFIRHNRSNSEGSLTEASRPPTDSCHVIGENAEAKKACLPSLLEPSKGEQYNEIRTSYADVLCRWELLEERAMIKKFTREYSANKDKEFHVEYSNCGRPSCKNTQCYYCKKVPYVCSICRLPVRGSSNFCLVCGHGGHTSHYRDWFEEFDECPTGCGCKCLTAMEDLFG